MEAEKIVVSSYLIMHLTLTDFVVGLVGALIRVVANYSKARHKIKAAGEKFDTTLYLDNNWDKIVYGLIAGLGLLFIVPEIVVHAGEMFFDRKIVWNSGFSGVVGLAGVEIIAGIISKARLKLNTPKADEPIEPIS